MSSSRSVGKGYVYALVGTALIALLRWAIDPFVGGALALLPFVLAVMAAAWAGGLMPGLAATALSTAVAWFVFLPPAMSFAFARAVDPVALATFVAIGVLISALCEALHAAQRASERKRQRLDIEIAERVEAEAAVRRQTAELTKQAELLDLAHDAILVRERDGRLLYWNRGAEALYGWTREDAIGRAAQELLHTRFPVPREEIELALDRDGWWEGRVEQVARDGGRRVVASRWALRHGSGEEPGVVLEINNDVTDQARAESALMRNERELADFFDNATVGLHWVGPDGRVLRVNRAELQTLGYAASEYLGQPISRFHADPEVIEDMLARLLRGETLSEFAVRMLCKDGSVKDMLVDSSGLWEDGQFRHTRCFTRDVTAQRRVERSLRESEQRFRAMADSAPVMIWTSDASGRIEWVNRMWLDFTGRAKDDERAKLLELVHGDDLERAVAIRDDAFARREPFTRNLRVRRRDGEYRWLLESAIPRLDGEGAFLGFIGSCVDITEHKRNEEALREADQRKDEFLATLAHELRNPLAPLRTALEILTRTRALSGDSARLLAMMERQVGHMVRLVDDLLEISRITRGKIELRRQRVELGSVIESAIELARPLLDAAGQKLEVDVDSAPLTVEVDTVRIAQVLGNLLNNAAKFSEREGLVRISARAEDGRAVVRVRDEGIGIEPHMLARIFEPFTQADQASRRSQGGLGIGLSLVRSLVALHEGTVTVRSDGPGRGSEFVVSLSLASAAGAAVTLPARAIEPLAPPAGDERRILIVDDNTGAADTLAMALDTLGARTEVVYDGRSALESIDRFHPSVVFMDIGMPGMDGHEVARRIRERGDASAITLIALSGWGQEEVRQRSRDAGFNMHLVKPIDLAELERLLATF